MVKAIRKWSGIQNVDGLLVGYVWDDAKFTWAMPKRTTSYDLGESEVGGFSNIGRDSALAVQIKWTLKEVELLTKASFKQAAEIAELQFGMTTTPLSPDHTYAYANYPQGAFPGDVWFNTTQFNEPYVGTRAAFAVMHEVGHALGLKHGHAAEGAATTVLSPDRDSIEFSVMTYRDYVGDTDFDTGPVDGQYPQSFMMYDIAALQYLYGADYKLNGGDTDYGFDPNTSVMTINGAPQPGAFDATGSAVNIIFRTVWDGNGTDTYDFSAYTSGYDLSIDLSPGGWSDVDRNSTAQAARLDAGIYARGQVFNAELYRGDERSLIENAIGGSGADHIFGNQADNTLKGSAGDDLLDGRLGDDHLEGEAGADQLHGTSGHDILSGGDGKDRYYVGNSTGSVPHQAEVFTGSFGIKPGGGEDVFGYRDDVAESAHSGGRTLIFSEDSRYAVDIFDSPDSARYAKDDVWVFAQGAVALTRSSGADTFAFNLNGGDPMNASGSVLGSTSSSSDDGLDDADSLFLGDIRLTGDFKAFQQYSGHNKFVALWHLGGDLWARGNAAAAEVRIFRTSQLEALPADEDGVAYIPRGNPVLTLYKETSGYVQGGGAGGTSYWLDLPFGVRLEYTYDKEDDRPNAAVNGVSYDFNLATWDVL